MKVRYAKSTFTLRILRQTSLALLALLFLSSVTTVETTLFSLQVKLPNDVTPATDVYEMEFKLFDAAAGGTQVGATNAISSVDVKNRDFTVWLDYGAAAFPGADRYIEISYRRAGSGRPLTTLAQRERILSVPYAIRALNATTADGINGVNLNDFVRTIDSRLSDSRDPNPGSNNYIQNTTSQQPTSNFSISGNGTAGGTLAGNLVDATMQYNIGGERVLAAPGTGNFFAGANTGTVNTGINNAFFGRNAGAANTSGSANSFFGPSTGTANTAGQSNAFFGNAAGGQNVNGSFNVYVGQLAGQANVSGQANTFIGTNAGASPTSGSNNVAVGADAGNAPTLGSNNTFLGKGANPNAPNLNFATAIGSGAVVGTNNTIVLGRTNDNTFVKGALDVNGTLTLHTSFPGASIPVCVAGGGQIGFCSSSLRYKSNVESYLGGLDVVRRLRPIKFNWKEGGMSDVGFAAEEVNKVEPRLTIFNPNGEIQGVKYGEVTTVLVNSVKEQQLQIEALEKQIRSQQSQIDVQQSQISALTRLVRRYHRKAVSRTAK